MKINLEQFYEKSAPVLSGREKGAEIRNRLSLDKIDKDHEPMEVIIPEELYSINSSFFLGLFGPSVKSFGEAGFKDKYIFMGNDILKDDIDDGISRALNESDDPKGKNEKKKRS